jgi:hypothetical protein
MHFLGHITIEQRTRKYGPDAHELKWFVCHDGCPMGPMFSFFLPGALRNAYPFPLDYSNGFVMKEAAEVALAKLTEHVNEVLAMPISKRPGSSKTWRAEEISGGEQSEQRSESANPDPAFNAPHLRGEELEDVTDRPEVVEKMTEGQSE